MGEPYSIAAEFGIYRGVGEVMQTTAALVPLPSGVPGRSSPKRDSLVRRFRRGSVDELRVDTPHGESDFYGLRQWAHSELALGLFEFAPDPR